LTPVGTGPGEKPEGRLDLAADKLLAVRALVLGGSAMYLVYHSSAAYPTDADHVFYRRPSPMPKSNSRRKKTPKRALALPDLEQTRTAVLNSLTSASGQRTYDHAIREFVAPARPRVHPDAERYFGCKQKLRVAVNDRLGIEPDAA
jgi:hypothetical protein